MGDDARDRVEALEAQLALAEKWCRAWRETATLERWLRREYQASFEQAKQMAQERRAYLDNMQAVVTRLIVLGSEQDQRFIREHMQFVDKTLNRR